MAVYLEMVEWWQHDEDGTARYRTCDMCCDSACSDAMESVPQEQWRQFFLQRGGVDDGLCVCEKCLPDYHKEAAS